MSTDLIQARKDAVARGDKALGREIYHQLINAGYRPEDVDASTFGDAIPEPVLGVDSPASEVRRPPSDDPEVVRLFEKRLALEGELGGVAHPKTGNPRRAKEVEAELERVDAALARATDALKETPADEGPETTAVEPPEKAVRPAPQKRDK